MTTGAAGSRDVDQLTALLRAREPEVGHLIAAIDYKRALVEGFGLERALELARPQLGVPGLDRLVARRVAPLADAARAASGFQELWPAGRPFVIAPPRVVGRGDEQPQHGVRRAGWVGRIDGAAVRGRSALVLRGDEALVDFERDELEAFPDHAELDPGVLYAEGRTYWTMEPARHDLRVDEALMLSGSHSNDFGHWLIEYLPKLALAEAAGLPPVPLLVDEYMPASHFASLDLLTPGREVIVIPHLAPCTVTRLWCAPTPMYRGYYPADWTRAWEPMIPDPERLAWAFTAIKRMAGPALEEPTGHDRVYLARRPDHKKRLVNHLEVEARAERHGFLVVHPEDLGFLEQLRLAHHARFVVAPEGSNGLLSYFGGAGARVCFLNHGHTFPLVELEGVLRALGMDFTVFTGPGMGVDQEEPFWDDYAVDVAAFERFLSGWLDGADADRPWRGPGAVDA